MTRSSVQEYLSDMPKNSSNKHPMIPEHSKDLQRVILSCWLGTMLEYADFALYGLAAGIIFGDVFFPNSTPIIALLSSFATYSVGFIARPIGALFFGWLGDRRGRKLVMSITIALMGLSTALIGVIPNYSIIGVWAPTLLTILRFTQGFGAGAELSGGTIMLGEYASSEKRGLISSVIALGSNSGTLLASGIWLLVLQMDKKSLIEWGWRIPFLLSMLVTVFAIFLRRYIKETPVFEKRKQQLCQSAAIVAKDTLSTQSKKKATFWRQSKAFWLMIGLRIGENGPSYIAQGFIVGYVAKVLMIDKSIPTLAVLIASILGFLIIPFTGYLSDRFGRRIVYRWFCLLLMLYAFPAFILLNTKIPAIVIPTIVIGMGLASLGIFGVQAAWGVELFGSTNRYLKMALAKELGSIVSGGTAPLVATAMLTYTGHWWPVAFYFALMATIGFITTFFAPETKNRDLYLPQDAV